MLELAREEDWEAVKRLSVQVHDLHAAWRPDIYYHTQEPMPRETFSQLIRERMIYVAKPGQTVVGYVSLGIKRKGGPGTVDKKILLLESICVAEGFRGQGLGKLMIGDVRALAKAFGCQELMLGVHPENDGAVAFYQKCGFRIRTINMDMKL